MTVMEPQVAQVGLLINCLYGIYFLEQGLAYKTQLTLSL